MHVANCCSGPTVTAAATPLDAPLGPRDLDRLNALRSVLERERRTSDALQTQAHQLMGLAREAERNASKVRDEIRRLVLSSNPDELA